MLFSRNNATSQRGREDVEPFRENAANVKQIMGLFIKKMVGNGAALGIWRMEEDESFFMQQLDLQEVETIELAPLKGRRRLEWLASRYLLHEMLLAQLLAMFTSLGHRLRPALPPARLGCGFTMT